jgi:hypothetical protein
MQRRSTTKIGHSTTANGMNNYKLVIDKKTRYVIMYKGKAVKKFFSLSDARDFLDYVENYERTKATMATQV